MLRRLSLRCRVATSNTHTYTHIHLRPLCYLCGHNAPVSHHARVSCACVFACLVPVSPPLFLYRSSRGGLAILIAVFILRLGGALPSVLTVSCAMFVVTFNLLSFFLRRLSIAVFMLIVSLLYDAINFFFNHTYQ